MFDSLLRRHAVLAFSKVLKLNKRLHSLYGEKNC